MSDKVVLGPPYEGGLWYLLSRGNYRPPNPTTGTGYYGTLYGPVPGQNIKEAINLATLFEEILLPTADEYLPDHQLYWSGDVYYNSELRIRVDNSWKPECSLFELGKELLNNEEIANNLKKHNLLTNDLNDSAHIIQRIISQIRLTLETNAIYIAGDGVTEFAKDLWKYIEKRIEIKAESNELSAPLAINTETLSLVGLDWSCTDLDSFAHIRQSKEISKYALEFRNIINASSSENLRENLLLAMRKAMSKDEVASKAKEAFETTGIISTIAGAIPGIGTVATLFGLGSNLADKQTERIIEENRWYLLGSKLREIELKRILNQEA